MTTKKQLRDYSIVGEANQRAQERGLIQAEWYTCPIPRQRMKELMKRKDGPAIRDTLIWLGSLIGTGCLAYYYWGTWMGVPLFFLYGVLYSTPAISRWHECGHGTAFRTPWMNEAVYQLASFMSLMQATPWRWSHARHHTDTIVRGSDPEIVAPRPPVWRKLLLSLFFIEGAPQTLKSLCLRAFGKLNKEEQSYIESSEYRKVIWEARVYLVILGIVAVSCVYWGTILPAMFIGLPLIYGGAFHNLLTMTQHLGLYEDVLDHRLNTRTLYTNRIIRFLYWNMNYHIEHHMFPMVPYHALPALHEEMKADCPAASPSFPSALKEVVIALWKQKKDPDYTIDRPLPATASPYNFGIHREVEEA